MGQEHGSNQPAFAVFPSDRQISSTCANRIIIDLQDESLLEIAETHRLADVLTLRNSAILLDESDYFLAASHLNGSE